MVVLCSFVVVVVVNVFIVSGSEGITVEQRQNNEQKV